LVAFFVVFELGFFTVFVLVFVTVFVLVFLTVFEGAFFGFSDPLVGSVGFLFFLSKSEFLSQKC